MAVAPLGLLRAAGARRMLVLGDATSPIVDRLRSEGARYDVVSGDWPSIQLDHQYGAVIVEVSGSEMSDIAVILHCAVQHTVPGGLVVVCGPATDLADRFELQRLGSAEIEGTSVVVARRTSRSTVHDAVFAARSRIGRVTAVQLASSLAGPERPLVVDTRTPTDRERWGVIDGSIHVPRTVLEWHLDPANGYRHPAAEGFDQRIVVVCNGGYSSSLAAASLCDIGFTDVSDLIGGVRAWRLAGLPVVVPDHTHLDL